MGIKHIWSVLCKESVINQDDNLISLHGVLEEVNSILTPMNKGFEKPDKIIIPFNYEIVSFWTKEQQSELRIEVKVSIIDPKGNELSEAINTSDFPKEIKRLRTRIKVQGLPVSENGKYIFRVSSKTNEEKAFRVVSELPLDVKFSINASDNKSVN